MKSYKVMWRDLKEYIMSNIIKMQNSKHKIYDEKHIEAYLCIHDEMNQAEERRKSGKD